MVYHFYFSKYIYDWVLNFMTNFVHEFNIFWKYEIRGYVKYKHWLFNQCQIIPLCATNIRRFKNHNQTGVHFSIHANSWHQCTCTIPSNVNVGCFIHIICCSQSTFSSNKNHTVSSLQPLSIWQPWKFTNTLTRCRGRPWEVSVMQLSDHTLMEYKNHISFFKCTKSNNDVPKY